MTRRPERPLRDYPLSLQLAAEALWSNQSERAGKASPPSPRRTEGR